jgi:Tol biopolymer transport system component
MICSADLHDCISSKKVVIGRIYLSWQRRGAILERTIPGASHLNPARLASALLLLGLAAGIAQAQSASLPTSMMFTYPWASVESSDEPPTSTPDGRTLLFLRSDAHTSTIFESHMIGSRWSTPVVASFSGSWLDQFPAMSPDGSYLIFQSDRPLAAGDGTTERLANLWRVDRTPSGWSVPVHLPATVNISKRIYGHSVAANGDIYFMSSTEPRGKDAGWRLFRAARTADGYAQAEALPFSDGSSSDVDPYIAPDQSYLIFASRNRREPTGQEHLFIAFHHGADWGPVVPIRYQDDEQAKNDDSINVSPDGKILYFESSRGGKSKIWTLPLAPYLSAAARTSSR